MKAMKRGLLLFILSISFCACNHKGNGDAVETQQPWNQTYECEIFSVSYPKGYYAKEDGSTTGDFRILQIGKDSLDNDVTTIMWEAPGSFPGTIEEFVTIFVSKEIEDYEKSNTFYDVMKIDSTYIISGYPTYSISSIFTEGEDTIIQSRTGLIIPDKMDMMIIQRVNTKKSYDEVRIMVDIIGSIKIK